MQVRFDYEKRALKYSEVIETIKMHWPGLNETTGLKLYYDLLIAVIKHTPADTGKQKAYRHLALTTDLLQLYLVRNN